MTKKSHRTHTYKNMHFRLIFWNGAAGEGQRIFPVFYTIEVHLLALVILESPVVHSTAQTPSFPQVKPEITRGHTQILSPRNKKPTYFMSLFSRINKSIQINKNRALL